MIFRPLHAKTLLHRVAKNHRQSLGFFDFLVAGSDYSIATCSYVFPGLSSALLLFCSSAFSIFCSFAFSVFCTYALFRHFCSSYLPRSSTGEYRKKKREITFHYLSHPVISCCSFSIFPVFPPSLSAHL